MWISKPGPLDSGFDDLPLRHRAPYIIVEDVTCIIMIILSPYIIDLGRAVERLAGSPRYDNYQFVSVKAKGVVQEAFQQVWCTKIDHVNSAVCETKFADIGA